MHSSSWEHRRFNECLGEIFSLLNLENFWFWVAVVWLLILWHRWLYVTSYSCPWIENLTAKTTKYIPKCRERSMKRKSDVNFIRVIKNWSFDQHFLYIWSKPSLKLFGDDFLFPAQNVSSLAVQLRRVKHEISQLCQC